jgi:hypothetical protein
LPNDVHAAGGQIADTGEGDPHAVNLRVARDQLHPAAN